MKINHKFFWVLMYLLCVVIQIIATYGLDTVLNNDYDEFEHIVIRSLIVSLLIVVPFSLITRTKNK